MKLQVPYDSQRDNALMPYSACNVTSLSMIINFLKGKGATDPDKLWKQANSDLMRDWIKANVPGSNWIMQFFKANQANLVWAVLERLGDIYLNPDYDCYFKSISGYPEVYANIQKGLPIMIGTELTGPGHIINIVGIEEPYFICHDPYGDATTGYVDPNGAFVKYSYQFLWGKVLKDRALFFRKN